MTEDIKASDLPEFDAAEQLTSDEDMAIYLSIVLEENDPSALAQALGTIARARGMASIAEAAGIGREALYKALRADAQPRFETISRVLTALGMKLTVQPASVSIDTRPTIEVEVVASAGSMFEPATTDFTYRGRETKQV